MLEWIYHKINKSTQGIRIVHWNEVKKKEQTSRYVKNCFKEKRFPYRED